MKKLAISGIVATIIILTFALLGAFFKNLAIYILLFFFATFFLVVFSFLIFIGIKKQRSLIHLYNQDFYYIEKIRSSFYFRFYTRNEKHELNLIYKIMCSLCLKEFDQLPEANTSLKEEKTALGATLLIYYQLLLLINSNDYEAYKAYLKGLEEYIDSKPAYLEFHILISEYLIQLKNKRNVDFLYDDLSKKTQFLEELDPISELLKEVIIDKKKEKISLLPLFFKSILTLDE